MNELLTPDEWISVANGLLVANGGSNPLPADPRLAALVITLDRQYTAEQGATMAEEVVLPLVDAVLGEIARSLPSDALYAKANELAKAVGYAG